MADAMARVLTAERYTVDVARDGTEALALLAIGNFDAVVLDRILPDMSRFDDDDEAPNATVALLEMRRSELRLAIVKSSDELEGDARRDVDCGVVGTDVRRILGHGLFEEHPCWVGAQPSLESADQHNLSDVAEWRTLGVDLDPCPHPHRSGHLGEDFR